MLLRATQSRLLNMVGLVGSPGCYSNVLLQPVCVLVGKGGCEAEIDMLIEPLTGAEGQ